MEQNFLNDCVKLIQKALTYKTISYDDTSLVNINIFYAFITFLKKSFPLIHRTLRCEHVNELSLLYTWEGSNPALKPILLLAHYDVVPVKEDRRNQWLHDPFCGVIVDGYIWGRGAYDNKGNLIAMLSAMEQLIKQGYKPERTIYLASGHDEEIGGPEGSKQISRVLRERGITFESIIDEGAGIFKGGIVKGLEKPVGVIGIAEKGNLNIKLTVKNQQGMGHAGLPMPNSPLILLSKALARIDKKRFPARLTNAMRIFLRTIAPEFPPLTRFAMRHNRIFEQLIISIMEKSPASNSSIRTTIVPTMIQGSDKINVIPKKAVAYLNGRILPGDDVTYVAERIKKIINDPDIDIEVLRAFNGSKESDVTSPMYQTIKQTAEKYYPGIPYAPATMTALTDSRHYHMLTDNIYRFSPILLTDDQKRGIHGANERITVEDFKKACGFYYDFIKAV